MTSQFPSYFNKIQHPIHQSLWINTIRGTTTIAEELDSSTECNGFPIVNRLRICTVKRIIIVNLQSQPCLSEPFVCSRMKYYFKKFGKIALGNLDVICPGLGQNPTLNGPQSNLI